MSCPGPKHATVKYGQDSIASVMADPDSVSDSKADLVSEQDYFASSPQSAQAYETCKKHRCYAGQFLRQKNLGELEREIRSRLFALEYTGDL